MSLRRGPLSIILVTSMVASTFSIFALAVLASAIIDDLGVSRTMIGVIGSVNTGVGALSAPYSGKLTDRIGPRNAVLVTMGLTFAALMLRDLNAIAPLLTMFFLTTYGVLTVTAGVERFLGSPSFRPLFKVHWSLSLLGAAG